MAGGVGAVGLAGGFAKGLSSILLANRAEQRRRQEREEDMRARADQQLLPIAMKLGEEYGDWTMTNEVVGRLYPDLVKRFKREGSPFDVLGPMLTQSVPGESRKVTEINEAGLPFEATTSTLPSTQGTIATQPVSPATHFLGQRMMTPEDRLTRMGEADINAKVNVARRLAQTQGITLAEAMDRVGLRSTTASMTPPQPGSIGAQVQQANAERAAKGQPPMTQAETQAFVETIERGQATAARGYGVDREALAQSIYHKSFSELDQPQQQVVIDEEKKMLQGESRARGTGTAEARFNAPVDIPTAQSTGVQVGTTAAQVAGQQVPTQAIAERRRSLQVLQQDLTRVQNLIDVLPSEKELAGVAPGGVTAVRRRLNSDSGLKDDKGQPMSYRVAYARLIGVVDSMVNVLARVRAEQRGTQTERDAERAYNSVVQLQAGLLDPLGGDTRESAAARIEEAMDGLNRVLAGLPTTPVPQPTTPAGTTAPVTPPATPAAPNRGRGAGPRGAGPAAAPPATGITMDDQGNIYQNGVLTIPAR